MLAATWVLAGGLGATGGTSSSYQAFLAQLPIIMLFGNSAHFAASTVRLYAKPGAFQEFPGLTMLLPLVAFVVASAAIAAAPIAGPTLEAIYLTWSPYHYAAQAYGLTLMYAYRSGCPPDDGERRLLRVATLLPFAYFFLSVPRYGVEWLVPGWLLANPVLAPVRVWALRGLATGCIVLPLAWWRRAATRGQAVPVISLLILLSNAIWWLVLTPLGAFAVVTVAHAVQYLVIVSVFHAKDHANAGVSWLGPMLRFYAGCVVLGYLLFNVWPYAYVALGYGLAESMMMVVAVVNIHHFLVDGYIWRLRGGGNRRIVVDAAPALA